MGHAADVVCIQETKLSRADMARLDELTICEGWDSYFSFCKTRGGYSGVATFCNRSTAQAVAAEDGMCGTLPLVPQTSSMGDNARISFPPDDAFWQRSCREHFDEIDGQGRCIITDHGSFVLLNVYGPAVTNIDNERFAMKMTLYQVLQHRIENMLSQGRSVVLVGDLNIAPHMLDHCDWCARAAQPLAQSQFLQHRPDRQWFQSILATGGGPLTDMFRQFHPDREKAYTVWNQKTGARATNYGSRVDFILAAGPRPSGNSPAGGADTGQLGAAADSTTAEELGIGTHASEDEPGPSSSAAADTAARPFVDSFTACDLWTECMGSDHCPVWATLDVPASQLPQGFLAPALSTSHTHAGEAHTLSSWLSHSRTAPSSSRGRKRSRREEEETPPRPTLDDLEREDRAQLTPGRTSWDQHQVAGPSRTADPGHPHAANEQGRAAPKQKAAADRAGVVEPQQITEFKDQGMLSRSATRHQGQSSITDFLSGAGQDAHTGRPDLQQEASDGQLISTQESPTQPVPTSTVLPIEPTADRHLAHRAPLCKGHEEPCVRKRVNKSGPNKGRYFFMCARPPAAGDEGQCKTFKWAGTT